MEGVLFVVMPFGGVERPQVGVSTLKAQLSNDGVPCDIAYFNIPFAQAVGYQDYSWITHNYSYELFAGEWLFARSLFAEAQIDPRGYVEEILRKQGAFTPDQVQRLMHMGGVVEPFLNYCLDSVYWDRYSIVGFTTTFEQNLASLSLARRIKQRFPEKIIAMGGGNCAGVMGVELHRSFPFLDYVFTGEADYSFPELVRRLRSGDPRRDDLESCVRRVNGESVETKGSALVNNLDALPYPNYDDFFAQFRATDLHREVVPQLQIETARGCWWGAKHHCTFCGLNRDEMTFRQKSAGRALEEILHLINRYDSRYVSSVDNIIGMSYFATLLPELKRRNLDIRFFWETKANLREHHVELFADAGVVDIQPGIESFSGNTLKLIRKGVSPLQNVHLLKLCETYGVYPSWNLLYSFPGETRKDYETNRAFAQALHHLAPPDGCGALRLDRFSPYFDYPDQFGIRLLGAMKPYRYLYPFEQSVLDNIAYFYDFDFDGYEKANRWAQPLQDEIKRWKAHHKGSRLQVVAQTEASIVVEDTRYNRVHSRYRFDDPEKSLIEFCDQPRSHSAIERKSKAMNGQGLDAEGLDRFLGYMVDHRLMLNSDDQYISLIMGPPKPQARRRAIGGMELQH